MQTLTHKEEEIMGVLWRLEKAFVKELLPHLPQNNHYNTVSTIVRNLEDKGYVAHTAYGKTHQYYPVISKDVYSKRFMKKTMERFFNNNYKNVVSFFAKEEKISASELREILALIEDQPKDN